MVVRSLQNPMAKEETRVTGQGGGVCRVVILTGKRKIAIKTST